MREREREREREWLETGESGESLLSGRSDLSRQSSESDSTRGSGVAVQSTEPTAARRPGRSRVAGLTHESAVTWHSSAALLALLSIHPGGSLPADHAWNTLDSGKPGSALRSFLTRQTSHTQPSYKPPSTNQSVNFNCRLKYIEPEKIQLNQSVFSAFKLLSKHTSSDIHDRPLTGIIVAAAFCAYTHLFNALCPGLPG